MKISLIVPMLNEMTQLPSLLQHLLPLRRAGCEVLIVDGGSQDGSVAFARALGFRVLCAPRGRARQMNAGASVATGEALVFLHADTRLPPDACYQIARALSRPQVLWGRFDVRIEGRSRWFPVIAALMNLRSRLSGIATGDQAIFVRRDVFWKVGGYPDQPLMEDIWLSRALKQLGRPACVGSRVTTSGRRWETYGVWRTILLMWRLRCLYWLGVPAEDLARAYP